MKLTDIAVRALPVPEKGQRDFWDDSIPSFGIRISQGGSRTWVLMEGGSRKSLGRYPLITLSEARELARRALRSKSLGLYTITYTEALELFLKTHCKELRTAHEYERLLRKHFTWTCPLTHVTTKDITEIVDTLPPITANNAFGRIRTFFRWAKARRYVEHSPCEGLPLPNKPRSRDRVLTPDEIKKVWHAAHGTFGTIVKLCLLTGQRRGEIAAIRPEWINSELITFPKEYVKNQTEHTIPLCASANNLLKEHNERTSTCAFLFSASNLPYNTWSKPKKELDEKSGTAGWTIHDLRRTVSTNLGEMQTPPHVIDRLLNHSTGSLHKRYNRYQYLSEVREALEAWEARLLAIVAQ